MTRVTYEVVQHNGAWAYRVGDVYSETFATHDEARDAAERAAEGHRQAGSDETVEYQDRKGNWHEETAGGDDRPQTSVRD